MKIETSKKFLKSYARLNDAQRKQIDLSLIKFSSNHTDPGLKDHPLKGKMKGLRAFSAGFDLRVIYREEGGFITVVLIDTGSHNQVY